MALRQDWFLFYRGFGAYGAAAAGVVIASDLMVDGFKATDEWLLRQGSNFIDWTVARVTGTKSLAEQERDLAAAEEESRKKQEASTAAKENMLQLPRRVKIKPIS